MTTEYKKWTIQTLQTVDNLMTTEYKKWTIQTLQHRRQLDDYWVQEVDNTNLTTPQTT